MTEKEANRYLEDYVIEIFGNTCHAFTNYAAVVEHPRKPKQFAIEVGAKDLSTFYIDNYVIMCRNAELKNFGFNASLIKKLSKVNISNKNSQTILTEIYNGDIFSPEEKRKVSFNSTDLISFNANGINQMGFSKETKKHFLAKDILPKTTQKIILPNGKVDDKPDQEHFKLTKIEGGISVSSTWVSNLEGTLGGIFKANGEDYCFGITNQHVLFRDSDHPLKVVSPGSSDPNKNGKIIGEVIFECFDDLDVGIIRLDPNIEIGDYIENNYFEFSNNQVPIKIGMRVKKYGLTTGYKQGILLSKNATINVKYRGETKYFKNQIMCSPLIQSGDSGSILTSKQGGIIGLLFAESSNHTLSFANHFSSISAFLKKNGLEYKSFINHKH